MATAGTLPPLSSNGKTFINDPKITGNTEVKASIKLKFITPALQQSEWDIKNQIRCEYYYTAGKINEKILFSIYKQLKP